MVHCGISVWCIVGLVRWVYWALLQYMMLHRTKNDTYTEGGHTDWFHVILYAAQVFVICLYVGCQELGQVLVMVQWPCRRHAAKSLNRGWVCGSHLGSLGVSETVSSIHHVPPSATLGWSRMGLNHWQLDCLINNLFRLTTKKTWKLCITVNLWGESISNAGSVSWSGHCHSWNFRLP